MSDKIPEDDSMGFIKERVHCCACGESMADSHLINVVVLPRIATWKYPTWGNVLTPGCHGLASAVVCDECIQERREVREAVEWDMSAGEVTYHPLEELAPWVDGNQNIP